MIYILCSDLAVCSVSRCIVILNSCIIDEPTSIKDYLDILTAFDCQIDHKSDSYLLLMASNSMNRTSRCLARG